MARRRMEGLERVLGVDALFSTAYGDVGSSIYYALGLVASDIRFSAGARGSIARPPHKVAIPQPVVDHEAEYDSVLVHPGDDGYDEQLVATAIKLAARKRRGIHVLVTIPVPNALPIHAPLPEQEAAADSAIEQAQLQGGSRVSGHCEKIRAGQPGRRIIEEAQDMRATAVVIGLPRRVSGASLFGRTLETVLAERPCRVVIESAPRGADGSASLPERAREPVGAR